MPLCSNLENCYILLKDDNASAVIPTNKVSSIKSLETGLIDSQNWNWAIAKGISLVGTHKLDELNGAQSLIENQESRRIAQSGCSIGTIFLTLLGNCISL